MRRLLDFFKGITALATIVGILVGPPLLLTRYTETRVRGLFDIIGDELASDATRVEIYLTSGLLLIFWLAWAMLAVSILTEGFALARGGVARRLPVFPGIQQTAGRLVASCALIVSSFGSMAPSAAAPLVPLAAPEASASALIVDDSLTGFLTSSQADNRAMATPGTDTGPKYEVQHGDTWWSLGERFLGDGLQWSDIVSANEGTTMADGTIVTAATQSPRAGWQIALPTNAVLPLEFQVPDQPTGVVEEPGNDHGPTVSDAGSNGEAEVWDVKADDHFWGIAEGTLSEAWGRAPTDEEVHPYWVQLMATNEDRLLPPDDPDMIYPDQVFVLPEVPPDPGSEVRSEIDHNGTDIDFMSNGQPTPPSLPTSRTETDTTGASDDSTTTTGEFEATRPAEVPEEVGAELQPPPTQEPAPGPAEDLAVGSLVTMPGVIPVPGGPQLPADPVPVEETPPTSTPAADIEDEDSSTDDESDLALFPIAVVVTGLGLAAAGLLSIINRLRTRRVGERQPGHAPKFKPPVGLEAELQRSADPDGLADVNRAMRYLGAQLAGRREFPKIVGISLETDRLLVLLAEPEPEVPAPFQAESNYWVLDRQAELPDITPEAVAPLPTLVTVGHTSRSQLLLDLEHAGVVNLTGTRGDVVATMTTMATELAASPLADQLEIMCVGFGGDLDAFERVTVIDDADEVVGRLRSHVEDLTALTDGDESLAGAKGRVNGIAGDAWTPMVVFAPDAEAQSELLELARTNDGAGVTALVTADGAATWQVHIKGDQLQIPHINLTVRRANFTAEQVASTRSVLDDARDPQIVEVVDLVEVIDEVVPAVEHIDAGPDHEPGDLWDPTIAGETPDDDAPAPPAAALRGRPQWPDVDYWVQVLGPVRVVNLDGEEVHFERTATAQLLAYLVQHRNGVTIDSATEAMFPNLKPNKKRMYNLGHTARKALGESADGEVYVPKALDGIMYVSDRVGSDFEQFTDLMVYAGQCDHQAAVEALREALELIRGEPFTGRGLDWATLSGASTDVAVTVDEAARTMATIALDHLDQPDVAAWAIQQGLMVVPHSAELHLLRLRAALARENSGVEPDAVFQHYVAVMEEDDDLPEGGGSLDERIVELYESYRRSSPRRWAAQASAS